MKKEKKGFFAKMLSSEHRVFETSMFGISVILSLALVIGIGYYVNITYFDNNVITDEEANASSVTEGALTVSETPEPVATPDGNVVETEEDFGADIDEELVNAKEGYTTTTVNMRSEASLTSSVVVKVPMGQKLTFIKLHDKEWMEVEYNGVNGYINAMYLSTEKPKPIETVAPRPTTAPVTRTAKPAKTAKPVKTPKATKTPKPTKTPRPAATAKPTQNNVVTPEPTVAPTERPATPEPTEKPQEKPQEKPTTEPTPGENTAAEQ